MSMLPKTLRDRAKQQLADLTTGLYMISATCGLVDAVCFLALGGDDYGLIVDIRKRVLEGESADVIIFVAVGDGRTPKA